MNHIKRTPAQKDRLRQARQVLAGDAVRPSPDPWAMNEGVVPFTPLQRNYVIVLAVLLITGLALAFILSNLLLASIPFLLLAIGLIAARFVF